MYQITVKVHRVSPSSCTLTHLHVYFNFIKSILETVGQSLHHSCRTELTRQGILLPQDRQDYGRRLLGFIYKLSSISFTLQHRADVRLYTSYFYFAKSYVFVKQSLPPITITNQFFFSRSYKEILQSSFSIVISYTLAYSANQLVLVFVRLLILFFRYTCSKQLRYLGYLFVLSALCSFNKIHHF